MSFRIIYVENDHRDYEEVNEAINKFNEKLYSEPLEILRANDPEDMKDKLSPYFDIVLADVYFDDPKTGERDKVDRLEDIIKYVKGWGDEYNGGRPLPIIAYSRIATLEYCFKWKDSLYDIWDKNTAFAEYVTWRLSKLAVEISRIQPDSHLQRLIREMANGAIWHENVKEMAKDYNSGWTEIDQIERAGNSVYKIAGHLEVFEACQPLWDIITEGEAITRAISHRSRGEERHVINVFWLGYYLLHHQYLHDWFGNRWQDLLINRSKMGEVNDDDPFEALSNIWFYAGLFHDVGRAVEKLKEFSLFYDKLFRAFSDLPISMNDSNKVKYPTNSLNKQFQDLINEIGNSLGSLVNPIFLKSLDEKAPDHGLVGALYLINNIHIEKQRCYAREAARAVALHHVIGEVGGTTRDVLSWKEEPIACLLLLCDQLQTWERERGDRKLSDKDEPERAELLNLSIRNEAERPSIEMHIDYIAPPHVLHSSEIYLRVKSDLEYILLDKPNRALNKIQKPWPFSLKVFFFLSREKILDLDFG